MDCFNTPGMLFLQQVLDSNNFCATAVHSSLVLHFILQFVQKSW